MATVSMESGIAFWRVNHMDCIGVQGADNSHATIANLLCSAVGSAHQLQAPRQSVALPILGRVSVRRHVVGSGRGQGRKHRLVGKRCGCPCRELCKGTVFIVQFVKSMDLRQMFFNIIAYRMWWQHAQGWKVFMDALGVESLDSGECKAKNG